MCINTTSPGFNLDVNGTGRFTTGITSAALLVTGLISAGNLFCTTSTIPNMTCTNISSTTLNLTGITTSILNSSSISTGILSATSSTIPNIVHTNITTTSLLATTQISTSSLLASNGIFTNLSVGNLITNTVTNISSATAVLTSATIANLTASNITSSNLNVSNYANLPLIQFSTVSGNPVIDASSGAIVIGFNTPKTGTQKDTLQIYNNSTDRNLLFQVSSLGISSGSNSIRMNTTIVNSSLSAVLNSNTIGNLFTTGGNVGINTTSPSFTLDVNGTGRFTTGIRLILY